MTDEPWLVGVGSADVTGEPWGAGMMGYGMRFQRTPGIHLRQRSRAFAVQDPATAPAGAGRRRHRHVLRQRPRGRPRPARRAARGAAAHGDAHARRVPGGFSGYRMYNTTNKGLRPHTLAALVDGVVASVEQALADLAPGPAVLSRGELHDASVNRSPQAFARNPRRPGALPRRRSTPTTLLRLERDGRVVGVVNWFATHGTSLTNRNRLISGDNKGYAARAWEAGRRLVAAFAQTNAGDMSPERAGRDAGARPTTRSRTPGSSASGSSSPRRRSRSGHGVSSAGSRRGCRTSTSRGCASRGVTPRRRPHRLSRRSSGAAFAAGTKEGPGLPSLHEGVDANARVSACSHALWRLRPAVRDAHAPKAMLLPVGSLGWAADRLPVQLVRLGPLVLVGLAQEVTVVAGLRIRRAVADVLDVPLDDVLVQGYANDYAGYVTTPEEYDAQRYEGGHTMFGRWELPAYLQEVTRVARDLRDGWPVASAGPPRLKALNPAPAEDPVPGVCSVGAPLFTGGLVTVEVHGDDPRGPARPSYFVVERQDGDDWRAVAGDTDWSTTVRWARATDGSWSATVTWHVPDGTAGTYRVVWLDRDAQAHPSAPLLFPA
jgi:neutral ceramidase